MKTARAFGSYLHQSIPSLLDVLTARKVSDRINR